MDRLRLRLKLVEELSTLPPGRDRFRRFAKYDGKVVLLDPKNYGENPNDPLGKKVIERVDQLAKTLHGIKDKGDLDTFRTLHCLGWFEHDRQNQFYFVYELPAPNDPPMHLDTLLEHVNSNFKPSVTARIRLAHLLALSLVKFHQKGWLHKGIRSDHVVFFRPNEGQPKSLVDPRLLGFDFARRMGDDEYSEKPSNLSTDLYRHPDTIKDPDTRFKAVHDYYSLGIVLVEIAVWRSIKAILLDNQFLKGQEVRPLQERENRPVDPRKVQGILLDRDSQEDHLRDIEFRMGEIYRKVVERCLSGRFGDAGEDSDAHYQFENHVVNELGRCVI